MGDGRGGKEGGGRKMGGGGRGPTAQQTVACE